ncbi:unnamed protein product, partial [Discosporangium mesarthrocarpum]
GEDCSGGAGDDQEDGAEAFGSEDGAESERTCSHSEENGAEALDSSSSAQGILNLKEFLSIRDGPWVTDVGSPEVAGVLTGQLSAEVVVLSLLAYLDAQSAEYIKDLQKESSTSTVPPPALPPAVHPHAVSFMLLHSLLHQLVQEYKFIIGMALSLEEAGMALEDDPADPVSDQDMNVLSERELTRRRGQFLWRRSYFLSAALISVVRILDANLQAVAAMETSPAMVGLGSSTSADLVSPLTMDTPGGLRSSPTPGWKQGLVRVLSGLDRSPPSPMPSAGCSQRELSVTSMSSD